MKKNEYGHFWEGKKMINIFFLEKNKVRAQKNIEKNRYDFIDMIFIFTHNFIFYINSINYYSDRTLNGTLGRFELVTVSDCKVDPVIARTTSHL